MTTKIHALVEGLGCLSNWTLTPGQTHDVTQAESLLEQRQGGDLVADGAYDADPLIAFLIEHDIYPVIKPRRNRLVAREFDIHTYKDRNVIERFFCRLKHFRRIATRYDKLDVRFSSFIAIVASFIWLI